MTGYPSIWLALLQGLIAASMVCAPPLVLAFGGKLKVVASDAVMIAAVFVWGALVTTAAFLPFEGDWADMAFRPIIALRPMIIGGSWLVLGTVVTQWHGLLRRGFADVVQRLGAVFVIGAVWGALWGLSGWILYFIGK